MDAFVPEGERHGDKRDRGVSVRKAAVGVGTVMLLGYIQRAEVAEDAPREGLHGAEFAREMLRWIVMDAAGCPADKRRVGVPSKTLDAATSGAVSISRLWSILIARTSLATRLKPLELLRSLAGACGFVWLADAGARLAGRRNVLVPSFFHQQTQHETLSRWCKRGGGVGGACRVVNSRRNRCVGVVFWRGKKCILPTSANLLECSMVQDAKRTFANRLEGRYYMFGQRGQGAIQSEKRTKEWRRVGRVRLSSTSASNTASRSAPLYALYE